MDRVLLRQGSVELLVESLGPKGSAAGGHHVAGEDRVGHFVIQFGTGRGPVDYAGELGCVWFRHAV